MRISDDEARAVSRELAAAAALATSRGPAELGYRGARGGGKSHSLRAQLADDRRRTDLAQLAGRECPDCRRQYGICVVVVFDGDRLICDAGEACVRGHWGPRVRHIWHDPESAGAQLILSRHER